MRLGAALPLPAPGEATPDSFLADAARRLANTGYESIWTFDSIGRGETSPDPLMILAVAATVTKNIELATGILQIPLRETVDLANRILTAQLICGERLLLGVGFGSTKADFDAVGASFEHRFELLDSQMLALRKLIETGKHEHVDLTPWPITSRALTWMLGTWGKHVSTAARHYDGWIASAHYRTDPELATALERYRQAGGTRAIVTNLVVNKDSDFADIRVRLEHAADIGFDDAVVVFEDATERTLQAVRKLI
jgi:alkanesulfonate monooxygenase SsuD/methylene tetrahydromethanopterin reductase-like flavin-dependent oxidoreductase (luciferase family)